MDIETVILWALLAVIGAWALYELCRWLGRWLGVVFFGREPGGRK